MTPRHRKEYCLLIEHLLPFNVKIPLNFMNECLIPLQNDPITYSFVNQICRTNFSPDPIRFHRVPLSLITVSPSPILLNHVLLCQRDWINEFLNPLQYDSITYYFFNEIRRNNFSPDPIRLHRVPFTAGQPSQPVIGTFVNSNFL